MANNTVVRRQQEGVSSPGAGPMSSDAAEPAPTSEASNPADPQPTSEPAGQPTQEPTSAPPADNTSAADDNNTQPAEPSSDPAEQPQTSAAESKPAEPTTAKETQAPPASSAPPAETTSEPAKNTEPAATSANEPDPEPTSSENNDDSSSSEDLPATTEAPASTDDNDRASSTVVIIETGSEGTELRTSVVFVTSTSTSDPDAVSGSASSTSTSDPSTIDRAGSDSGGGLNQKSKVAIGVVVPIAAIAILAIIGLFWWKKRRARMHAEEERRKEVEDYAYNPNNDPTIPAVGMGGDGPLEMREDGASGYRGWGTTTMSSAGRKASTTMSGGVGGTAYSDGATTLRGNMSDSRSGEPLVDGYAPEGEILGAMGPSAAINRGADVHRGPSNASSSYSAAAHSDNSDGMGVPYGAGGTYYDQYGQSSNPYGDNNYSQPQDGTGGPVIRDNPARRNTRIESPSHYPQQSAGISQNF